MGRGKVIFLSTLLSFFFAFAEGCGAGAAEPATADEQLLKSAQIETDGPNLLAFFRQRSLTDEQQERLAAAVRQLGSQAFKARTQASEEIVAVGPPARPFLQRALQDQDPEIARRARACLEDIERQPGAGAEISQAAVRVLVVRNPPGAVEALFKFLPFNDDECVEEEILAAANALAVHDGKVLPSVMAALRDPHPPRRAGAAYILGRVKNEEERSAVRRSLTDAEPKVRLRAAQALVAAGDKGAVPTLINLIGEPQAAATWKAEELLYRIAGEEAPQVSLGNGSAESRQKYRDAWAAWWRDQGAKIDLAKAVQGPQQLGLTLLAEMDSNQVSEFGSDGKMRWKLDNLQGPVDAQVLPGGRILVAEYRGRRVTERDLSGNIQWSKQLADYPVACQRLPNGNTFIATQQTVQEVTRDGKEVYLHRLGPGLAIYGAQRLPNGHIVCIANSGVLQELDASGRQVKNLQIAQNRGGWCGVEALPGGRYLVALMAPGKVIEVDSNGKTIWEYNLVGACHATRLPNGNTLVASMTTQRLVEVNREGKTIKETATSGRPWRVHSR